MRLSRFKRLLLLMAGAVTVLGLCLFIFVWYVFNAENVRDWFAVMQASRGLPTAQARFDQIYNDLILISEDTLLQEVVEPLYAATGLFAGCIRGTAERVYGANRPYDQLLADYRRKFEAQGWEYIVPPGIDEFPEIEVYAIDVAADVLIEPISKEQLTQDINWKRYQTVYSLYLKYAEPEGCWG